MSEKIVSPFELDVKVLKIKSINDTLILFDDETELEFDYIENQNTGEFAFGHGLYSTIPKGIKDINSYFLVSKKLLELSKKDLTEQELEELDLNQNMRDLYLFY